MFIKDSHGSLEQVVIKTALLALTVVMLIPIKNLLFMIGIRSFLISSFLLWKILSIYFLGRLGIVSNRWMLFSKSFTATLGAVFIIIIVSHAMFTYAIEHINSFNEISWFAYSRTYPLNIFPGSSSLRSYNDIYMWSLFGVGACYEMAYVSKIILEEKGYEAYIAGFPGEDHVFTVVYAGDSWIVLDPGYPCCRVIPLSGRVKYRMRDGQCIEHSCLY